MGNNLEKNLNECKLKRQIRRFFNSIEMKQSSIGYIYWLNAISYCVIKQIEEGKDIEIKEVYTYIANKYNTSVSCVEKSMRYAKQKSNYMKYWKISVMQKNHEFLSECVNEIIDICFTSDGGEGRKY